MLGESARPASRHLYAYAEGEPIAGYDPDGRATIYSGTDGRYGNASSQTKYVWPKWNDGGIRGKLVVASFIPEKFAGICPWCGRGDYRSWSNPFYPDCWRSRICAEISFGSTQYVRFTMRPSCGPEFGDCRNAWPLDINSSNWFVAATNRNAAYVSVRNPWSLTCGTELYVAWSGHQSYLGIPVFNATIDGGVSVRPCKDWPWDSSYKKIQIIAWGDGYPSVEHYYTKDWSTVWALRVGQSWQNLGALPIGVADWMLKGGWNIPW